MYSWCALSLTLCYPTLYVMLFVPLFSETNVLPNQSTKSKLTTETKQKITSCLTTKKNTHERLSYTESRWPWWWLRKYWKSTKEDNKTNVLTKHSHKLFFTSFSAFLFLQIWIMYSLQIHTHTRHILSLFLSTYYLCNANFVHNCILSLHGNKTKLPISSET